MWIRRMEENGDDGTWSWQVGEEAGATMSQNDTISKRHWCGTQMTMSHGLGKEENTIYPF